MNDRNIDDQLFYELQSYLSQQRFSSLGFKLKDPHPKPHASPYQWHRVASLMDKANSERYSKLMDIPACIFPTMEHMRVYGSIVYVMLNEAPNIISITNSVIQRFAVDVAVNGRYQLSGVDTTTIREVMEVISQVDETPDPVRAFLRTKGRTGMVTKLYTQDLSLLSYPQVHREEDFYFSPSPTLSSIITIPDIAIQLPDIDYDLPTIPDPYIRLDHWVYHPFFYSNVTMLNGYYPHAYRLVSTRAAKADLPVDEMITQLITGYTYDIYDTPHPAREWFIDTSHSSIESLTTIREGIRQEKGYYERLQQLDAFKEHEQKRLMDTWDYIERTNTWSNG